MRRRVLILAALSVLVEPAAADFHDRWLLGTWVLDENPDGAARDWLVFAPQGRVTTRNEHGRTLAGGYRLQGPKLHLYFEMGGRLLPLVMTFTQDRSRLHIRSERTGNTATYRREAAPDQ